MTFFKYDTNYYVEKIINLIDTNIVREVNLTR